MTINEHAMCSAEFKRAFGADLEPPSWSDCRDLEIAKVMAAITRVDKNPLTRFYSKSLISGKVLQVAKAKGKRSHLVKGK